MEEPTSPLIASMTSGRSAWFSMLCGSRPESPSTVPSGMITVIRVAMRSPSIFTSVSTSFTRPPATSPPTCSPATSEIASRSQRICSM